MMKIKLVSDQSRFIEQEKKLFYLQTLNKLGVFNLSYSITNWKNNFKIYDEDDLINSIDENQSNVNLNWLKSLINLILSLSLISLQKMISNLIIYLLRLRKSN